MKEQPIAFPLTNEEFLKVISNSFYRFLAKGTSRSNDKLKPLHGAVAQHLHQMLGDGYEIVSQGYGKGKEAKIDGRYVDKMVDITVRKEGKPVCGIAVKFVMQNYSQNSNNYFENMLGETANIRSNNCPYFQVFIILDRLPYYTSDKDKTIKGWETFTRHNASKYAILSHDNTDIFFHTPNKTLIYVVHIPDNAHLHNKTEYLDYYSHLDFEMCLSDHMFDGFGEAVIINDFEGFVTKVYYTILSR